MSMRRLVHVLAVVGVLFTLCGHVRIGYALDDDALAIGLVIHRLP